MAHIPNRAVQLAWQDAYSAKSEVADQPFFENPKNGRSRKLRPSVICFTNSSTQSIYGLTNSLKNLLALVAGTVYPETAAPLVVHGPSRLVDSKSVPVCQLRTTFKPECVIVIV